MFSKGFELVCALPSTPTLKEQREKREEKDNLISMASNLLVMASNLRAMASNARKRIRFPELSGFQETFGQGCTHAEENMNQPLRLG